MLYSQLIYDAASPLSPRQLLKSAYHGGLAFSAVIHHSWLIVDDAILLPARHASNHDFSCVHDIGMLKMSLDIAAAGLAMPGAYHRWHAAA